MTEHDRVEIEVLLKPAGAGFVDRVGGAATRRPDPGDVERCRRWFANRGLSAHATDFGVVCSGPKAAIEEIFGVKLLAADAGFGMPPFIAEPALAPPAELAELIEAVTIPGRPEFFP